MPKRPYQIKLDSKTSLLDLGKSKKYILLADYRDASHMRNELAFYLADLIGEKYPPKGKYVNLYIDDDYRGLYLLTTKNEIGGKRIDLKDPEGVVMELDNYYKPDDEYFISNGHDRLSVKDSNSDDGKSSMQHFRVAYNAFEEALDNKDWPAIESLIDVESFAQYYLLSELTSNPDAYLTSCYFYKDGAADKIHAGPIWDFDIAYGNSWGNHNSYSYSWSRSAELEHKGYSKVYMKLSELPEFQSLVTNLFNTKLSAQKNTIIGYIDTTANEIRNAAVADNAKWIKKDFDTYTGKLKSWISSRFDYMNLLYGKKTDIEDGFYKINNLDSSVLLQKNFDGSYRITQTKTWKVLDILGGSAEIGATAQWYPWNGSSVQRWFISKDANGKYYLFSKHNGLVLDAKLSKMTELDVDTYGQALSIEPISAPTVDFDEEQEYTITSSLNKNLALDISGASSSSGANLQIWSRNKTIAQRFTFKKQSNGTYEIINVGSGKVVDVSLGSLSDGANVQQYERNGTVAQQWWIISGGDGSITFVNNGSGKALDVADGNGRSGVNVWQYTVNNTKAQKWKAIIADMTKLAKSNMSTLADGDYVIRSSLNNNYVLDVQGGSNRSRANIQLYSSNNTVAQKWRISHDEDGYVTVANIGSSKPIDVSGGETKLGTNIQQYESNDTKSQKWVAIKNEDNTVTLVSALDIEYVLDVSGGNMCNGSNIQLYESNNTGAQKWVFERIDNE